MKKLINDSEPASPFPVRKPPGLEFGPHNSRQSNNASQRMEQTPRQTAVTQDNLPSLIDLSYCEVENARPMVRLPTMESPTPASYNERSSNAPHGNNDDKLN